MNDQKTTGTLDLLDPSRDLIIRKVLESKDELANIAIFKWLLENDFSSIVLQVICLLYCAFLFWIVLQVICLFYCAFLFFLH